MITTGSFGNSLSLGTVRHGGLQGDSPKVLLLASLQVVDKGGADRMGTQAEVISCFLDSQ